MPLSDTMQHDDLDFDQLMKTLTDSFNVLADEVQLLSDKKTILEHKLSFAREQYQHLADTHAPESEEICATLAALQIPPDQPSHLPERATFVPLPAREVKGSKQQTAEAIRDGRQAAQRIANLRGWSSSETAGDQSMLGTANTTITTSHLEQDFTIPGKMSKLQCPFAPVRASADPPKGQYPQGHSSSPVKERRISQLSADPICAALYNDAHELKDPSVSGSATKCPIRYLDQHSPEEVAEYFENHKHEIPRSHEVCVRRYQRNEDDIRKLDAKYGNLVSMIQGLGQKHQPMLPSDDEEEEDSVNHKSSNKVEHWAKTVTADDPDQQDIIVLSCSGSEEDRESHFHRALKEVRLGESPSRPWGIRAPFVDTPSMNPVESTASISPAAPMLAPTTPENNRPAGRCPFGHGQKLEEPTAKRASSPDPSPDAAASQAQPAFLQRPDSTKGTGSSGQQMLFTGPVFIGYPLDQAMALMQQWQRGATNNGE
ncbi:MAG: hypothetical protein M1818_003384 [Claussenomyces sp. TS43310]|nr:MAG: hypothetical protein M1818_003384 [Claussenomyces sp. TS43310]